MTILVMDKKELEKKVGKIDEKLEKTITDMGTPIEYVNDTELAVEVFPNRPDLLSLQNFAQSLNQYRGKGKIYKSNVKKSNKKLVCESSLPKEWPFALACIVRGIKFDDEKIKHVIDIQEKLGMSILRKRKRGGIGIYPLEKIEFPIKFIGKKPEEIKFRPLEFPKEINAKQILRQHPTGREYGSICQDWEKFPVFVDNKGTIMSMPPIINSHDVGKISETTHDIFLEATGNNLHYIQKAFNIMVTSLEQMGGKIESITCIQKNKQIIENPNLEPEELSFNIEDINKNLGLELSEKEVKKYLERMGIDLKSDKKSLTALIPAVRSDILHWIDLVEEVAIAYGYDKFEPIIPNISTIGEESSISKTKKVINNILTGANLLECSTYHLTTKKNIKKTYFDFNEFLEVEDSKNERDVLRYDLLTNLLQVISQNSDSVYPQKIYEIGTVFEKDKKSDTNVKETEKLGIAIIDENVTFTDLKQILDYLFKMLDIEYRIEEYDDHPGLIPGRGTRIIVNDKERVGFIGEISPRVLKNWKIKAPVIVLEMDIGFLLK